MTFFPFLYLYFLNINILFTFSSIITGKCQHKNGAIVLEIDAGAAIEMRVRIPENTTAEVYLPLINNELPKNTELEFTVLDGYARFILTGGEYRL